MLFASVTLELVPYIMLMIFYPHATPGKILFDDYLKITRPFHTRPITQEFPRNFRGTPLISVFLTPPLTNISVAFLYNLHKPVPKPSSVSAEARVTF